MINPDGRVIRTIKEGTTKIDNWPDPLNKTIQTFTLTQSGVAAKKIRTPRSSGTPSPAVASQINKDWVSPLF